MSNDKTLNKQILKRWQFWVVAIVILSIFIGLFTQDKNTTDTTAKNTSSTNKQKVTYTITGEVLGEYGKEIILNKNTDTPAKKYLYKLPEGTYKVTTSFKKMASFFIVKDAVKQDNTNGQYPESLNYVGEAHLLTAGDNNFNGNAKKEDTITLANDESIQIVGAETFVFEKQ